MRKGFFARLAAGNIRKNAKTYLPYILTCVVTVAMFYVVKSLSLNPGLESMAGGNFVRTIMGLGSGVVSVFSFIFLFYTNSFLVKRRKKEFGVFNVLGMEKRHLSGVVGWETLYVMLISLILGLGIGIALDKVLFLAVVRLIRTDVPLGFFFSGSAVIEVVTYFTIVFVLIYANTVRQIHGANPVELIHAQSAGEKEPKANWLLAILGFVTVGSGYYLAVTTENPIASVIIFFVAVLLVIGGTYLLFTAGSIAFLKALRKNKRFYYQTKHFISVSGMLYRMKQNAVGLANICILSTMVLVMVSTTTAMIVGMEDIIRNRYPGDFVLYCEDGGQERESEQETVRQLCREQGLSVEREWSYGYLAFQAIRSGDEYHVLRERARSVEDDTNALFFITLDDYNAVTGEDRKLDPGEILLYSNRQQFDYTVLKLFGTEYRVAERLDSFMRNGRYEALMCATHYIVVPDLETFQNIFKNQKEILTDLAGEVGWVYGFDTGDGEEAQRRFYKKMKETIALGEEYCLEARTDGRDAFLEINGGLFFIGIFLGSLFVMATVLIIYYKQISEGYDDRNRFVILQKVGMSQEEVKASIHSQVLMVFFLPLVVAGIHVTAASPLIARLLALLNLYEVGLYVICVIFCILVFAVLYILVYVWTARTYYRIVSR